MHIRVGYLSATRKGLFSNCTDKAGLVLLLAAGAFAVIDADTNQLPDDMEQFYHVAGPDCSPGAFNRGGERVWVRHLCPPADHPRHPGPVIAMAWSSGNLTNTKKPSPYNPDDFNYLGWNYMNVFKQYYDKSGKAGRGRSWSPVIAQSNLDDMVAWLKKMPEGRRGLTVMWLVQAFATGWLGRDFRDGPILAVAARDIAAGEYTELPIEPLPADWSVDEVRAMGVYYSSDVPYQDNYMTFMELSSDVKAGATTLPVYPMGGQAGEPVVLTAPLKRGAPIVSPGAGNSFWMVHSARASTHYVEQVAATLKREGLTLDYLIMDHERGIVPNRDDAKKANRHDPRWDDPAWGFEGKSMAELEKVHGWNTMVKSMGGSVRNWWIHVGIFQPMQKHFPKLKGSNYSAVGRNPGAKDKWSYFYNRATFGHFGTHGSKEFYANSGFVNVRGKQPYHQVYSTVGHLRGNWAVAGRRLQTWFAWKGWTGDRAYKPKVADSPFYDEMLRHMALHEPDPMLYWTWHGSDSWNPENDMAVELVLREVNEQLGGGYSLLTMHGPNEQQVSSNLGWEYPVEVVTGVVLEDNTTLWRLSTCRSPAHDGPIEITIRHNGRTVGTATVPKSAVGTWWRYKEAVADLAFDFEYPVKAAGIAAGRRAAVQSMAAITKQRQAFRIDYALVAPEVITISLHSMKGRLLRKFRERKPAGTFSKTIPATEFAKGAYVVSVRSSSISAKQTVMHVR